MNNTVVSIFSNRQQAEKAVDELRRQGFDREISIISKDEGKYENENFSMKKTDSIADSATTGSALGGIAGLAAGAGMLAIPGIGPILAMGPIAGLLAGAAAGGIAGGLIDLGIPEEESRKYEEQIKQGNTLVAVQTSDDRAQQASEILRENNAEDVKIHR